MAQRSLLCIEPDGATVGEIRRSFGSYGFRVESIPNGEQAVEWARTHNPALIILSVEPRKVGYAICNKLKRSPSLREIPLVLISAEETMATFEQHRKLKSRAEEYLLKPLDMKDLLAKADRLIGIGDAQSQPQATRDKDSAEIEIADDEIAEVSLDDEDLEEEAGFSEADQPTLSSGGVVLADGGGSGRGSEDSDSLRRLGDLSRPARSSDLSGPSPFHDAPTKVAASSEIPFDAEQFDQETQAAFAALEAGATEGGDGGAVPAGIGFPASVSASPASTGVGSGGDSAGGDGPMADGFKLRPINFTDSGTIETIVEGYTFWRVANGGPGLPTEATPWDSAMPEWKLSLTEEERWKIILAEYDLAQKTPRIPEQH